MMFTLNNIEKSLDVDCYRVRGTVQARILRITVKARFKQVDIVVNGESLPQSKGSWE